MKKNNNLQFKKSVDWDSVNNPKIPRPNKKDRNKEILMQRERAKIELINKYNMSELEAERTLQNIERKAREKRNKKVMQKNFHEENTNPKKYNGYELKNEKIKKERINEFLDDYDEDTFIIPEHAKIRERKNANQILPQKQINGIDEKNKENEIKKSNENKETANKKSYHKNVDEIISNVIPDYNKHVSIEVNDVSLTFEIEKDKIDNLKKTLVLKYIKEKKLE